MVGREREGNWGREVSGVGGRVSGLGGREDGREGK